MIEAIVIVSLLSYIAWKEYQTRLERRELLELAKAKDLGEVATLTKARKKPKAKETVEPESEFTAITDLTEDEFDKHIEDLNKNE